MRFLRNQAICILFVFNLIAVLPARADFQAAERAYDDGDYAKALKELKPLAEQGNADAQALLGMMYNLGRGVPLDITEATKLFKAAADQGNAAGQCRLGSLILKSDPEQGLRLLKLSAEQGFTDSYLMLGLAYMNLKNVPHDPVQADLFLRLAAEHGDPLALGQLGKLESHLTREQVAKAQALAADWKPKTPPNPTDKVNK